MGKQNTVANQENILSGSYRSEDCHFLLKPISVSMRTVENKEGLIQSGEKHYSEMISMENHPTQEYVDLFLKFTEMYKTRLASEIMSMAAEVRKTKGSHPTVVSLARAGTPIGVILHRALKKYYTPDSMHFSVSIIRDRGIDFNALNYIIEVEGRDPGSIVFVDGWTGKGAITKELKKTIAEWNSLNPEREIDDSLYVVSDIGATATFSATSEDYIIPSGIMNSTVSGLLSRTVLNDDIGDRDFHGCVSYDHLKEHDFSRWFVDQITDELSDKNIAVNKLENKEERRSVVENYLTKIQQKYGVSDLNRIKPSIAEATRVLLRRVPDLLIVKDLRSPFVEHLLVIAKEKNVAVEECRDMPFNAISLIRDVTK